MGLFSKIKAKHKEDKKAFLKQEYPAVYVNMCFFELADRFAKENGAFTSPTGRIDFWTYLYWYSRDIIAESVPDDYFAACFCTHLDMNESYLKKDTLAALEYMHDSEDELDRLYRSPAETPMMFICSEAINKLYGRLDPFLSLSFAQYLARSMQIACEAFPKNK